MPTTSTPGLERVAMSWEDYLDLPEKPKNEWVDGVAVIHVTPPRWQHGIAQLRLGAWFQSHLPDLLVTSEAGVRLPGNRLRVPDLVVAERAPTAAWFDATTDAPPVVVVEILSPSTRSEDLVRKAPEYAAARIQQFWVVDPDDEPSIEVNELSDGRWVRLVRVTASQPTAILTVPGHGEVELDFREIFRQ